MFSRFFHEHMNLDFCLRENSTEPKFFPKLNRADLEGSPEQKHLFSLSILSPTARWPSIFSVCTLLKSSWPSLSTQSTFQTSPSPIYA